MNDTVLDCSALLAVILREHGADKVEEIIEQGAIVSAVNLSEAVAKLSDSGIPEAQIHALLGTLKFDTVEFGPNDAWRAGLLRPGTRMLGLSLGERACLALAVERRLPVVTADRVWAQLDIGVEVVLCR